MEKRTIFSLRKYGKQLCAVVLATVALAFTQGVSADEIRLTQPYELQITADMTEYRLQAGDTLWAVSEKIGMNLLELANYNNVNLAKGEDKRLPVGFLVKWPKDSQSRNGSLLQPMTEKRSVQYTSDFELEQLFLNNQIKSVEWYDGLTYVRLKENVSEEKTSSNSNNLSEKEFISVEKLNKDNTPKQDKDFNSHQNDVENLKPTKPEKPSVSETGETIIPPKEGDKGISGEVDSDDSSHDLTLYEFLSTKLSNKESFPILITSSEMIDNAILIERGNVSDVEISIVSWKKAGEYTLQKGVALSSKWTKESVVTEANKRKIPVLFTGGFWQYENVDEPFSQKELSDGKYGVLYSDGKNNIFTGDFRNKNVAPVMETMKSEGWNVGAFGTIIKDGKFDNRFANVSYWEGDINRKSARTLFVEMNDGILKSIVTTGHSSFDTGLNHSEIKSILSSMGEENIKTAFMLDGGGSTRLYTKSDSGQENVTGSFVDERRVSQYLYLTKDDYQQEYVEYINQDKLINNTSESVTYEMYESSKNEGLDYIAGTEYPLEQVQGLSEQVDQETSSGVPASEVVDTETEKGE